MKQAEIFLSKGNLMSSNTCNFYWIEKEIRHCHKSKKKEFMKLSYSMWGSMIYEKSYK